MSAQGGGGRGPRIRRFVCRDVEKGWTEKLACTEHTLGGARKLGGGQEVMKGGVDWLEAVEGRGFWLCVQGLWWSEEPLNALGAITDHALGSGERGLKRLARRGAIQGRHPVGDVGERNFGLRGTKWPGRGGEAGGVVGFAGFAGFAAGKVLAAGGVQGSTAADRRGEEKSFREQQQAWH